MPVIETDNLVKQYGKIEALRGLTLNVEIGEIFGLLGQNGAGKTTLVKILLGITKATAGQARLLGQPAGTAAVRKRIGYLPEDHRFPEYHTGYSLLEFYGTLLGVPRQILLRRIDAMLDLVGLQGRKDHKLRTYSKGMKQRVGIAQALLHNPEVIFLDEPTDGVDPVGRREIRRILQELKSAGKTIFLNSHMLGEVELICDRVAILRAGELIREGDIASLTQQRGLYVLGLAPGQQFPRAEVASLGYEVAPRGEFWEVAVGDGQDIDAIVDLLRSRGLSIRHLTEWRQTLEDLFMETVVAAEPGIDGPTARQQPGTTAITKC
ncbi:MAG TPA: ABC transporter ATP-binding protein [Gemmataceae bacterium]|nr:ABC transporter ATP-binding protein [Gemmataceae bacterium]